MTNQIIGVCGYSSSGSSAVTDLLREFSDANVLDSLEFSLTYYPDGLDDLDWHLNHNFGKHFQALPIRRFRRLTGSRGFMRKIDKNTMNALTDEFLQKIIQVRWKGTSAAERDRLSWFIRRALSIFAARVSKLLRLSKMPKIYFLLSCYESELAARPENFGTAAAEYVNALLDAMGRDKNKITVLNQPFCGNNPAKSFKYFGSPKAVVVDRDPRDCYLFSKLYLRGRGAGMQIASDTAYDFIKWFKTVRTEPDGLRERGDILFINFEQMIYDYENTVQKIAEFCGVSSHTNKGGCFMPAWSRNNSQLFKKYKGYEKDIAEIERELPGYLFPFEKYPDIKPEGEMFFGSQSRRG
jgi:hypothetical protein